ncbi:MULTISPECIES: hypothetical protein [Anaerotruncus]|jgi:hypothetical protein|uniref:Zinc-finger domain-containing protein n=1 Tax=Anaerotruncus colihominis TaxID=169435 RepID=A0A845SXT0_9FIRM|nr:MULTISPECIES: hypothetical protein [Anaerotruncus]MCI8491672.1 hypothetical protein [Anaerotruncus sp.]MCR2025722.1 hypothetical protein [Anaerotruncus colihominis]NDO38727.1 hypothetical protein [Anaerotruncus colihominis]
MNELFKQDGCLTDYALSALIHDEPLDELERLELSEHLSFCDACIERYTSMLSDDLLILPTEPIAPTIRARLRDRARKIFLNRYTTAAAAACFAVLFWNLGVFDFQITDKNWQTFEAFSSSTVLFSERTTRFTDGISAALNQWIYSFNFERGSNHEEK